MLRLLFIALFMLVAPAMGMAGNNEKPTVAVLYFDNNSGDADLDVLSKGFADMLITDISGTGSVTVVEREKLQALLDESKLQRSKFFDRKTAVKIGKGLGARYVLSGSFMRVKPQLRIDVRMIDVTTSTVVLATQVKGGNDDIFALEQKLVGDFMAKLNHKFFAAKLPPTKVPNLAALLAYSEALALIDKGEDAKAAAQMQRVVRKAPAFGLARSKHNVLVRKLAESGAKRDVEMYRDSKALFAEAKAYVGGRRLADLSKQEASHYLAYRHLLSLELSTALHPVLQGRKARRRAIPRKGGGKAVALMRAYYNNTRLLIEETDALSATHGRVNPRLPEDSYRLANALKIDGSDHSPAETLLGFLLHGELPEVGGLERYRVLPALADLDPKMKKAALALAKNRLALKTPPGQLSLDVHQSRVLESLARWHIQRGRIEAGIGEYQKILDRFPRLHRWSYIEKTIQQELGLKRSHSGTQRAKFEKGLATCDDWPYHVAMHTIIAARANFQGLRAIPAMEKKLKKQCAGTPKYAKMQKTLYKSAFLMAANLADCEWFELYLKKWLAVGGSATDGAGYRKNYSDCP